MPQCKVKHAIAPCYATLKPITVVSSYEPQKPKRSFFPVNLFGKRIITAHIGVPYVTGALRIFSLLCFRLQTSVLIQHYLLLHPLHFSVQQGHCSPCHSKNPIRPLWDWRRTQGWPLQKLHDVWQTCSSRGFNGKRCTVTKLRYLKQPHITLIYHTSCILMKLNADSLFTVFFLVGL